MRLANFYFSYCYPVGTRHTFRVGGRQRTFRVHLPRGHDLTAPLPVVIALHGATMNGPMMAWFSGLNRKADAAGFIAVYPDGTGRFSSCFWNGGNCCGSAYQEQVDDVGFFRALLHDLGLHYPIDTRRIYVTGFSNGGIMAYRLAAELNDQIAAIAPVAGVPCLPVHRLERPVPVLHFHGTEDLFVPSAGGVGARSTSRTNFRSVAQTMETWIKLNQCQETPRTDLLSTAGGLRVTRQSYAPGPAGAEIVLVLIEGGGHTWPGQKPPARVLGKSTTGISANDLMWEFFEKHRLP